MTKPTDAQSEVSPTIQDDSDVPQNAHSDTDAQGEDEHRGISTDLKTLDCYDLTYKQVQRITRWSEVQVAMARAEGYEVGATEQREQARQEVLDELERHYDDNENWYENENGEPVYSIREFIDAKRKK